jgi:3-hydroxyacyl-CoA dehydrogenase
VGVGWAIVFARAGLPVALYEPDEARRTEMLADATERVGRLVRGGLVDEPVEALIERIGAVEELEDAVADASHVQECAPERLDVKRALFARLEAAAPAEAVLASSSSALVASDFAGGLRTRERCLVAHPANPPYLLPVVELVPAPFTAASVLERACALLERAAMSPVVVDREIEGFIFNRLQGALLREAYCLVRDAVASVDAVDRVVRDGLGRRWSVIGPFETAELNTRGGIEAHAQKLGPAYARMGAERGQDDPWTPDLVARVAAELHARLPRSQWNERVAWRDEALIALERARRASSVLAPDPR